MAYLYIYGDPIPGQNGVPSKDQVRLEDALSRDQINDYRTRFKMIPRQVFDAMMAKSLANYTSSGNYLAAVQALKTEIQKDEKKAIYALMLDLFNEVNQAEMMTRGFADPWEWEAEKMRLLYVTQAEGELASSNPELFLQSGDGPDYTKMINRQAFETRAVKIGARIADQAYSIQFLAAINLLLDQERWAEVDLILKTYESLPVAAWAEIQKMFGG